MQLPDSHTKREYENLLPLVNVVFLLLIFFMVAGAFSSPDPFNITPTIAQNDSNSDAEVLTVIMSEQGELAIDGKIISIQDLALLIQESLQSQTLKALQLKPDANADALNVVELLEYLSNTELEAVHILTNSDSQ